MDSSHPVFNIRQRLTGALASQVLLAIVTSVDHLTGPTLHLEPLYLLPVSVAAWTGGRVIGYVFGIASTLLWQFYAGEPYYGENPTPGIKLWNLAVRLVFYPAVVETLIALKTISRRLESRVDERTAQLRAQVAERQRAEDTLRKLAAQLSEAEDAERKRIAYDIHDALSQMLGLVKLNLEAAVSEALPSGRLADRLRELVAITDALIRQTREMTFDLHPSSLDDLGLVPTLRGLAEEFHRRTGTSLTISETGERANLPSVLASWIFRALKELFNNAVKHGSARDIVTSLHWISPGLRIVIDDDGCGFDPRQAMSPTSRRGLGLAGIGERLASLGGKLHIESQPGQGTRAIMEIPLSAAVMPVE